MKFISSFGVKLEQHLVGVHVPTKPIVTHGHFPKISSSSLLDFLKYMVFQATPFCVQLCYFVLLSSFGYFALKFLKPRSNNPTNDIDLFFTSVSATTVSSMVTLEMEVFSSGQLIVITILMFLGGDFFVSMLHFHLQRLKSSFSQTYTWVDTYRKQEDQTLPKQPTQDRIELGLITYPPPIDIQKTIKPSFTRDDELSTKALKYKSTKILGYVILAYLIIIHLVGTSLLSTYISLTPSAHKILKNKGLVLEIFSIFTTVSTFSNCGFAPTNENMVVFRKNSGLLLILIPQILLGNTMMYQPCLRFVIYVLEKITKRKEYTYILVNHEDMGHGHLIKSSKESWYQVGTVFVLIMVQFFMFSIMEWSTEVMEGMNLNQKIVGSFFQTINSRHAGESILDLSAISPAILLMFIAMMYLPPCTFLPVGEQRGESSPENEIIKNNNNEKMVLKRSKSKIMENILFSQLCYLAIFVIIICITERRALKEDPLNFNLLNILFELTSAYGNVGFSMGYSCKRRLNMDENCVDKWYGFAGRWSNAGKFALILVMFMGRLKKFNFHGGKAWKMKS